MAVSTWFWLTQEDAMTAKEGHESARTHGKSIGHAAVTDDAMLGMALQLRAPRGEPAQHRRPARHHQG